MNLGDFLKVYTRNKAIEGERLATYEEFERENGLSPDGERLDTLAAALGEYERSLAGYGVAGETLMRSGLAESGYGDYLSDKAGGAFDTAVEAADKVYQEEKAEALRSYSEYLADEEKTAQSLRQRVLREVLNSDMMHYDDVYSYAVTAGLGKSDAKAVAELTMIRETRNSMRDILDRVLTHGFDRETALRYAMAAGLSLKDAKAIAELSDDLRDRTDYYYDVTKKQ